MDERGLTIQTVVISAVMALVAAVAGIVIYNIVADETEDIEEAVEEVSDITLFTEEPDEPEEPEEPEDPDEPDEPEEPQEPGECAEGEVRNDQGECVIEECAATQIRNDAGECEEIVNSGNAVKGLHAGATHTCAIIGNDLDSSEDAVWCWGDNSDGQIGQTQSEISHTPVKIPELENIGALSVGDDHACAIVRDSESSATADVVECWGNNDFYMAGQPFGVDPIGRIIASPERVAAVLGVQAISTGSIHTCVIGIALFSNTKTVECWGNRERGVLGEESANIQIGGAAVIHRNTVSQLSGQDLKAIEAGLNFTCVIVGGDQPDGSADTVSCWGDNTFGQLGTTGGYSITPREIAGLTGVKAISAGTSHICAIVGGDMTDGSEDAVWCWGDNSDGQLGPAAGTMEKSAVPIEISDFEGARSLVAGGWTTCVITLTNSYKCVGLRARDGSADGTSQPDVSFIAAGGRHVCIAYTDNAIKCFGDNFRAQIGRVPINVPYNIPNKIRTKETQKLSETGANQRVSETLGVKRVSVGNYNGCFITSLDTLACWGRNHFRQLGPSLDDFRSIPFEISELTGVTDISNNRNSGFCAIASKTAQPTEKSVKCWGDNAYDQLGQPWSSDAATVVPPTFVDVTQPTNPKAVSIFWHHACAIADGSNTDSSADDTVWCWGRNNFGQVVPSSRFYGESRLYVAPEIQTRLLNGIQSAKDAEESVSLTGVKALSAGGEHTCAIAAEIDVSSSYVVTPTGKDTVYCWGDNFYAQLGMSSSRIDAYWPRPISELNGAKAISAGSEHTCAITAEDTVKCWGKNNRGQLGTAPYPYSVASSTRLVDVPGLKRATAISGGLDYTCAIAAVLDGSDNPTSEDAVYCWGWNNLGLIGAPYSIHESPEKVSFSATPVRIQGITAPVDISTNIFNACAIAADLDDANNPTGEDAIWCWGDFLWGVRSVLYLPGTTTYYWIGNYYAEPAQISGL